MASTRPHKTARALGEPVVEGVPDLVLRAEDREPLADLIADILVSEVERAAETPTP